MKKGNDIKIKFSKEAIRRMNNEAHRDSLIEEGLYAIPTHKVHKNKKAYSRKNKKHFSHFSD